LKPAAQEQAVSSSVNPAQVRAVVFDLGGVFLEGGPNHVKAFGPRHGLTQERWDVIREDLFVRGDLWGQVERAELTLERFGQELQARMAGYGVNVTLADALNFMGTPGEERRMPLRQEIVVACLALRQRMPTALLTNNIREWREGWRKRIPVATLFDVVVDSCEVGCRKPEPRIYALVEEGLGLPGRELLFIDDIGVNLKAAHARGWQTVKYDDTQKVLRVLESVIDRHPPRGD
jgi:epoxide hydrolase-like predicted phosphatase